MSCLMNINLPIVLRLARDDAKTKAYIGNTKKNTLARKTPMLLNFDVKM